MTTIAEFHAKEIKDILLAIKKEEYDKVVHWLPRLKHAEQFMIMESLPPGILEDVHHFLFDHVKYIQNAGYEAQYTCDAAVTLLRQRGIYSDIEKDDSEENKAFIKKLVEEIWTWK